MVTPLKIVYIIDVIDGDLGGTENQLIKKINGLNSRKFHNQLICLNNSLWFQKYASRFECETRIININKLNKPSTYLNVLRLIKYLRNYKPDIVHTFFPVGNSIGVLAAKLAGVKNIISSRRDYGEWMNYRYLFVTRIANRFVTKIIANSQSVKELTEKKESVSNSKVEVILNGINATLFKGIIQESNLKQRWNIPNNDKVVGIVANFRAMKHHYTFIKAAGEILKVRKDVSFVLVGTGENRTELETLGASLNIDKKLFFTGPQADVIPYLSIMDVGVNCSKREGLSNAVMEYMAAGVPCVVSRSGGNPDLITHDVNGYTFELDDYKTLADLTLKLLQDKKVRETFIKNAREKIDKEMSLETMLFNYEVLYEKLVKRISMS